MNTNNTPEDDKALRNVMGEWRVDVPLPPGFQEQVWQRIAKAEARPEPGAWVGLRGLIEAVLPRPSFAYAYLAVLLVSGVIAGSWAAQVKTSRLDSELSVRYVQSIDPYRAAASQP